MSAGPTHFSGGGCVYTNPTWANVVLNLHMDGTNGQTTWTDTSLSGHTVSRVGNTVVDNGVTLYGDNTTLFDGNGDILSIPDSTDFDFGTGDWTHRQWIYANSGLAGDSIFGSAVATGFFCLNLYFVSTQNLVARVFFDDLTGATLASTAAFVTLNTLHYIEVCRVGTSFYYFFDGVEVGPGTRTTSSKAMFNAAAPLCIGNYSVDYNAGAGPGFAFDGRMRELQIVKGQGLHTANFCVPAERFPDS